MPCAIRLARPDDLPAINEIYNYYVARSTCTYQEAPESLESRHAWLARHGAQHPVTVAERDGQVVGWGAISPYHTRSAYRFTIENSVYVHHAYHRQGIGSAILDDLIARARNAGHRTIVAAIDASQDASVSLHVGHGFVVSGRLNQVGRKFGQWLDVVYMQLMLAPKDPAAD